MQKIILTLFCLLMFSTNALSALQFTFVPEVGIMGGATEYELDIKAFSDSYGDIVTPGTWKLRSLLEFPLNTTIGGVSTEIRSLEDPNKWSIELKYLTNLNNPTDKMLDSDWQGYSSLFPYTQFSYTESNVKMNMTILDAEFRFRISQKPNYDISIIAGGMYQKIYQNVVGYEGWQRQLNYDTTNYNDPIFDTLQNRTALTYEIISKQFKIGLQTDIYLSKKFTTQLKVAFAPGSFNDIDDHVLRNKMSVANGDGNGYIAGLKLRYNFSHSKLSFIQLSTNHNYFSSNGSQIQEYYGDDLGTPEDDTGDISPPLPHTIKTKQTFISLLFGFVF